jgi:hypothetical protein
MAAVLSYAAEVSKIFAFPATLPGIWMPTCHRDR